MKPSPMSAKKRYHRQCLKEITTFYPNSGNNNPAACSFTANKKLPAHNSSFNNNLTKMETSVGQKRNRKLGVAKNGESHLVNSSGESEHEVHILTERERRKKMRIMFTNLHSLLPQLPAKADKSTIVDEAIKYVKTLEDTLQTLKKKRQEKLQGVTLIAESSEPSTQTIEAVESREKFLAIQGPTKIFPMSPNMPHNNMFPASPACFQTWFSPNVIVSMCGNDAQISVCSMKKPELLSSIFYILQKHKLDVVSAHISSDQFRSIYMIHVHAGGASGNYPEALSVEDTFKLAAGEMNLWLFSC